MARLTQKQENFVLYLFSGDSQRVAYRKSFPSSKKWSDKVVDNKASELAHISEVMVRLKGMREEAEERSQITMEDVIKELANIALFDIRKIYNDDGRMLHPHELSDAAASVVSGFKSRRETTKGNDGGDNIDFIDEYKTYDKTKALDMLMKYFGGYEKDKDTPKEGSSAIVAKEPEF